MRTGSTSPNQLTNKAAKWAPDSWAERPAGGGSNSCEGHRHSIVSAAGGRTEPLCSSARVGSELSGGTAAPAPAGWPWAAAVAGYDVLANAVPPLCAAGAAPNDDAAASPGPGGRALADEAAAGPRPCDAMRSAWHMAAAMSYEAHPRCPSNARPRLPLVCPTSTRRRSSSSYLQSASAATSAANFLVVRIGPPLTKVLRKPDDGAGTNLLPQGPKLRRPLDMVAGKCKSAEGASDEATRRASVAVRVRAPGDGWRGRLGRGVLGAP